MTPKNMMAIRKKMAKLDGKAGALMTAIIQALPEDGNFGRNDSASVNSPVTDSDMAIRRQLLGVLLGFGSGHYVRICELETGQRPINKRLEYLLVAINHMIDTDTIEPYLQYCYNDVVEKYGLAQAS